MTARIHEAKPSPLALQHPSLKDNVLPSASRLAASTGTGHAQLVPHAAAPLQSQGAATHIDRTALALACTCARRHGHGYNCTTLTDIMPCTHVVYARMLYMHGHAQRERNTLHFTLYSKVLQDKKFLRAFLLSGN